MLLVHSNPIILWGVMNCLVSWGLQYFCLFLSLWVSQRGFYYSNYFSVVSFSFHPSSYFVLPFLLSHGCSTPFLHYFHCLRLFLPSLLSSVKGVHPVQQHGCRACVAAGAGDRWKQRALAPPPPAAVLPVAAQTSELRPWLTLHQLARVNWLLS